MSVRWPRQPPIMVRVFWTGDTDWSAVGAALALAASYAPRDVCRRLQLSSSADSPWEGLAPAVGHASSAEDLELIRQAIHSHPGPALTLAPWVVQQLQRRPSQGQPHLQWSPAGGVLPPLPSALVPSFPLPGLHPVLPVVLHVAALPHGPLVQPTPLGLARVGLSMRGLNGAVLEEVREHLTLYLGEDGGLPGWALPRGHWSCMVSLLAWQRCVGADGRLVVHLSRAGPLVLGEHSLFPRVPVLGSPFSSQMEPEPKRPRFAPPMGSLCPVLSLPLRLYAPGHWLPHPLTVFWPITAVPQAPPLWTVPVGCRWSPGSLSSPLPQPEGPRSLPRTARSPTQSSVPSPLLSVAVPALCPWGAIAWSSSPLPLCLVVMAACMPQVPGPCRGGQGRFSRGGLSRPPVDVLRDLVINQPPMRRIPRALSRLSNVLRDAVVLYGPPTAPTPSPVGRACYSCAAWMLGAAPQCMVCGSHSTLAGPHPGFTQAVARGHPFAQPCLRRLAGWVTSTAFWVDAALIFLPSLHCRPR